MSRSVNQGIPQHQKPFHTEHTAQICQTWHHQDTVQVKHICTQPHSLISHFPLQGRAHLHGAPLPSPTFGDQDQDCDCNLIDIHFMGPFCQVGPTTCLGPVHVYVLTHYLVAYY